MFLPWARADKKLEHHNLDDPGVIYRSLLPKVYRAGPAYHGTSPTDVRIRCQVRDVTCVYTGGGRVCGFVIDPEGGAVDSGGFIYTQNNTQHRTPTAAGRSDATSGRFTRR